MFTAFENCFSFSKTRRTRKIGKTCLVSSLFFLKNITQKTQKTQNLKNKEEFSERTPFWCSLCFKKQEPNKPLGFMIEAVIEMLRTGFWLALVISSIVQMIYGGQVLRIRFTSNSGGG